MASDRRMTDLLYKSGIRLILRDGQNARFIDKGGLLIHECRSDQPLMHDLKVTLDCCSSGLIVTEKNNFPEIMRQLAAMN